MFKWVIELKFFGRAISNNKNVQKEIEIKREAVQFTDGVEHKLRTHQGESLFQLLRMRTGKYTKSIRKVA